MTLAHLGRLYDLLDDVRLPDEDPQVSSWELRFPLPAGPPSPDGPGPAGRTGVGRGGSTYALALGLRESPSSTSGRAGCTPTTSSGSARARSPAKFFTPGSRPEGETPSWTTSLRLEPFLPFLEIHAGDLWQTSDPLDRPGGVHCVDIAKTARVFRCVTERFLTRLRPGSVVLHQDFAGPRLPWLHHSTGALLPYVEIAGPPIRSTLAFEVVRPIPEEVLRRIAEDAYTVDEKLALISAVQDRVDLDHTGGIPFKPVLEFAKAYVAHYAGDHRRAWSIAKPLTSDAYLSRTRADHFAQVRRAY
ncbi:hypothetical protein [Streptomyces sp. MNU103]|uniref:hypothetical protein n=1 Tax=Streptomyces sp. MNU103 TaxID=2560024 RepID=UPI001E3C010D|nr:hypothetical protein [Streptomyces sp. MNU103]